MTRILLARSISEEFSSGDRDVKPMTSRGDSETDSIPPPSSSSSKHDKDEESIKVYDGNQGLRRRQFRPVLISKSATVDQILSAALRAFHITKPTDSYYLTDAYDEGARVTDPNPISSLKRREGKRAAVFIRFRYLLLKCSIECGTIGPYLIFAYAERRRGQLEKSKCILEG